LEIAKMRQAAFALLFATGLVGCATNGYQEFYTSRPGTTPEVIAATRAAPPSAVPQVAHAPGFDGVADAYARKGYAAIGASSFSSGHNERDGNAIDQAKQIGADLVVIIDPKFAGSQTTSIPITTPTTSTSYTNGSATAFGAAGTVTAFGNATTTTYGSETTYVPMTVNRYDYGALYFVRRRYSLGANFRDLNDDERRQLQTNRGAYINLVVDGSPAYESDILPGDVIVAVNGHAVNGSAGLSDLLRPNGGHTVQFTIIRQGKLISKSASLLE
jgi:hypothetical protein